MLRSGCLSRPRAVGALAEGHLDLLAVTVAEDLERHPVARLEGRDAARQVFGPQHLVALDREDHVAAGGDREALEADFAVAALEPRLVGGPVGDDFGEQPAVVGVEVELVGELRVERLGRDADVGVFDLAVLFELGDRALDRRDRDREADPVVGAGFGLDLLVDADHLGLGVEQRAARVAGVDRGVGLDRALDLEFGQRVDRAVGRRDDPDRERVLLAEGAADRRHRLPDDELAVVAEPQRVQVEPVRLDLDQGDVGEGVEADDLRRDHVAVGELDVDRFRLLALAVAGRRVFGDDVGVGDDPAAGVEDEARALGGARLEDRANRDHARCRLLVDLGRVEAVGGGLRRRPVRGAFDDGRRRSRRPPSSPKPPPQPASRPSASSAASERWLAASRVRLGPAAARGGAGTSAGGRSSVKAVKRLFEVIEIRPRMRCASSRAIARPSPEPSPGSAV